MHPACWSYVESVFRGTGPRRSVVEFGSRDVNGSVRRMLAGAEYVGVDRVDGPGVDVVADVIEWSKTVPLDQRYDTVLALELLEHVEDAAGLIAATRRALQDQDGLLILTAASMARVPHSGIDGFGLRAGEFYRNVTRFDLQNWLKASFGYRWSIDITDDNQDIRAIAWTDPYPLPGRPRTSEVEAFLRHLDTVEFPR